MSPKAPKSVREQKGCANCKHCIIYTPQDDPTYYYCAFGAPPIPTQGKDAEVFSDERAAYRDAIREWREGRAVAAHWICDHFEAIDISDKRKRLDED